MIPLQPADWPNWQDLAGHAVALYPFGHPMEGCLVSATTDEKTITLYLSGNRYYSFPGIDLYVDADDGWLIGRHQNDGREAFAIKIRASVPISH